MREAVVGEEEDLGQQLRERERERERGMMMMMMIMTFFALL
jgi:hypothetical protein